MSTIVEHESETVPASQPGDIKIVPQEAEARRAIRTEAKQIAVGLSRHRPLNRGALEELARTVLARAELGTAHLGFAMVAISNEFWRDQFAAVTHSRRLLMLPHCLRNARLCSGTYTAIGLTCVGCGVCVLSDLKTQAESLGYKVMIAEGTPAVVQVVLRGRADAILGVACLDSLEKAFQRVVDLGIPHVAVPLLKDGCADTLVELELVRDWMHERSGPAAASTRSYVPLLRAADGLFDDESLQAILANQVECTNTDANRGQLNATSGAESIALDWIRRGGKRFRPFITLASFAAMVHGGKALRPDAILTDSFSLAVKRVAAAIEILHKASLVHDDIEDDDQYRYGRATIHRRYGLATAINVGDYLIGLGYRLIASGKDGLGADCMADILDHLSQAHLKLSRGQGAELLWRDRNSASIGPLDVLSIYALKTAPAFEVAMYAGVRMARSNNMSLQVIKSFCRSIGVAYQILNDLEDWEDDDHNKLLAGQDAFSERPTVLHAFALEVGDDASNRELLSLVRASQPEASALRRVGEIYEERGAFTKAEQLIGKYRSRAKGLAEKTEPQVMRELMNFIVDVLL